jgi:hypothetical protein
MPRVVPSQVVEVIDRMFPQIQEEVEGHPFYLRQGHSAECAAILDLLEQLPSELLIMDSDHYVEFISSVAAIRDAIEFWRNWSESMQTDWVLSRVKGLRELNPITLIRQALTMCPDEFPSPNTQELTFISDGALRQSLRSDISAVNQALLGGEWKAATVLAGSVVEALLLWKLQQQSNSIISAAVSNLSFKVDSNLEKWDLYTYIQVAAALTLIKEETATQCTLAKNFRNLIHPGRAKRLGQVCNRGTALSAVASVELVIKDLTP